MKDANDHFANIETAYLLQRTEALVILASNLKKKMDDEAFVRRAKLAKLDEAARAVSDFRYNIMQLTGKAC